MPDGDPTPDSRGVDLLLVEDDPDSSEAFREILQEAGYRVAEVHRFDAALALLHSGYQPSATIVDYMMPDLAALEFLLACQSDQRLSVIPVVVLAAGRSAEDDAPGMAAYLQKPFAGEELLQAVTVALRRRLV